MCKLSYPYLVLEVGYELDRSLLSQHVDVYSFSGCTVRFLKRLLEL